MASIGWRDLRELDVLLVTSLIWFLAQFVRYVLPPLFGTFRETFGVSNTTLGLLFTSLMLAYAAMQFPSGAIADRVGATRVVVAGVLVAAGGALVAFAVRSFPALVVAAILIGLGTGAHKTVAITLLSRVYPGRTGRVLGSMDAIGQLGGVAGPAAVVAVLSVGLAWENLFLAVGVVGVGLGVTFRSRMARRPSLDEPTGERREDGGVDDDAGTAAGMRAYLAPFADPRFSTIVVVSVAFAVTWNGMTAFLPLYLESEASLTAEGAGLVYSLLFLATFVQPVTGALADRLGRHGVMVATLGLATAALAVLTATPVPTVALVAVPLVGIGSHGFRPVRDAYLVETIPDSVGGGTLGMVRTIMVGAGAMAPAAVGYLSETFGFGVAFGGLTVVIVLATGLVGALALIR